MLAQFSADSRSKRDFAFAVVDQGVVNELCVSVSTIAVATEQVEATSWCTHSTVYVVTVMQNLHPAQRTWGSDAKRARAQTYMELTIANTEIA